MTKDVTLYGLEKCSTCKKARDALTDAGWQVSFRDVQAAPLDAEERARIIAEFDDKIINRASLTWRGMSEEARAMDPVEMLAQHPSVMKRPAIVAGDLRLKGWTANVKRALGVEV